MSTQPTSNPSRNSSAHRPSTQASTESTRQWEGIYQQVPLCDVPRHFAGIRQSPFLLEYLSKVLALCPRGGRTLETGVGSGYGAIWLSLRGVDAGGIDLSPNLVERARQINTMLGGSARFWAGDLFSTYPDFLDSGQPRYHVIHHQGVLEHFTRPQLQAAIAQQVASANYVVFSVPSVNYPYDPEFGNERLLTLDEWQRLLEPFEVEELRYYGDPNLGGQEHVLAVLRGQEVTPDLLALMQGDDENSYLPGISAIVHTRNEERHIRDCLQSLQGWTDEIIVCDMESSDATVAIAQDCGAQVIPHPLITHFDRARNVSAMRARHRWVFYLDADERVPPRLGQALRQIAEAQQREEAEPFGGMLIPFKHHFAGKWMHCLYPGYTAPRLLRNGSFVFNARHHSGAQVEGPIVRFPANDPELALVHYSFDSLSHYLTKLNRYTDGEAASLHRDGAPFHWQRAIQHFVQDFQSYYAAGAVQDGVHGFLYAFLSGFYRFEQHAKLFETRYHHGQLTPTENAVPASIEEMLEFALQVARQKPLPVTSSLSVTASALSSSAASGQSNIARDVVWSGPLLDPSGYGEECRHFLFGLDAIGHPTSAQVVPWSHDFVDLPEVEHRRLSELCQRPVPQGFIHVSQNLGPRLARHPQAGLCIGRTMFETDRLPQEWVNACNQLDAIWVPSAFNQQSFADAGVARDKLAVIPGALDAVHFRNLRDTPLSDLLSELPPNDRQLLLELQGEAQSTGAFTYLAVFDWTLHKGWDVLLQGFLRAFEGRSDVRLWLKVWSTNGYTQSTLQAQAAQWVQEKLGHDLLGDPRIHFIPQRLSRAGIEALYKLADAFVLPSRGEGWGRPYMEAMALGKPTIGTNWSANTAFMSRENSFLLDAQVVPVPERGWREVPPYRGHRWAEPSLPQLVEALQHVRTERSETEAIGKRASQEILERFDRPVVARQITAEVERLIESRTTEAWSSPPTENAETSTHIAEQPVRVHWEGALFRWHSLAQVNREMALALLNPSDSVSTPGSNSASPILRGHLDGEGTLWQHSDDLEFSLLPTEPNEFHPHIDPRLAPLTERQFAPLSGPADVHIRHFFPPRFERPSSGKMVLIQPWEYGYLPQDWIAPFQTLVDEVWCYSEYVRQVYLSSGIAPEKLQVVPLGVDTEVFHPQAPPYVFTDEPGAVALQHSTNKSSKSKPFVFLFVGGTLHRKGIDILLDAYQRAFTRLDDVCLVIKDTGTKTVYRGDNWQARILQQISANSGAPIVYTDADLSSHQLAGLYTASDCLVQPYRGEGFCLPALEAMACGLPVIVPEGGPTDDFVDESVGWRLAAGHKPFAISPSGNGRIGEWDCVGPTWMFEIDPDDLARTLRRIASNPEEAHCRGEAAAERAKSWSWQRSGDIARKRLLALREGESTLPPVTKITSIEAQPTSPPNQPAVQPSPLWLPDSVQREQSSSSDSVDAATRRNTTISLCMIVRDEERVLGDCLESAKPWFDEIILVDTGSTDRTVEIATEHGARVFHFPWCDDFSAARNVSLQHATGQWVFWMDADDTLPPECGRKLRELASLAEDRITGFVAQVHIPPAPGETGFTIVDHVKLFRNHPQLRFVGRIHEQILEPIHNIGGQVERSDVYVVHSGYDYSPQGQEKKRARDLTILEKDLAERPGHPFVLFNIGMTAYHMKEYPKATEALQQCLAVAKPRESIVRKVYAMLTGCFLEQKQLSEARQWLERGLDLFPHDPELLFRAGIVYRELGELELAERAYLTLLTHREQGHIDSLDVTMTGFKAHHNLALIYCDMGKFPQAEAQFKAAIDNGGAFTPSWLGLADICLRQGRLDEARYISERLSEFAPEEAQRLRAALGGQGGL